MTIGKEIKFPRFTNKVNYLGVGPGEHFHFLLNDLNFFQQDFITLTSKTTIQ